MQNDSQRTFALRLRKLKHGLCINLGGGMEKGMAPQLQYSCLGNPMNREAWWAAVHVVAKSRTRLSDIPFTFPFHALEKEMATHSSVLAWRIPGTGEPGGLPSMGSHRVRHDWSDLAAATAARGGMMRWEGGSKGKRYMYSCIQFILWFDGNQQNSVKQLSFN